MRMPGTGTRFRCGTLSYGTPWRGAEIPQFNPDAILCRSARVGEETLLDVLESSPAAERQ